MNNNVEATGFIALIADIGGTNVCFGVVNLFSVDEPGLVGASASFAHYICARSRLTQ